MFPSLCETGMVHWPGDPEPSFERISELELGAEANVTLCRMTAHTGTHMDAPAHFLPGNVPGIDAFPLDVAIGRARVVARERACYHRSGGGVHRICSPANVILFQTRQLRGPLGPRRFPDGFRCAGCKCRSSTSTEESCPRWSRLPLDRCLQRRWCGNARTYCCLRASGLWKGWI